MFMNLKNENRNYIRKKFRKGAISNEQFEQYNEYFENEQ